MGDFIFMRNVFCFTVKKSFNLIPILQPKRLNIRTYTRQDLTLEWDILSNLAS